MIPNATLEETKFRNHKLGTNDLIIKLHQTKFIKESNQVKGCGTILTFSKQEHKETKEQRKRLKDADFCKFRFCEMCNWRRTKRVCLELIEALEHIQTIKKVSYLSLTLTIRNPKTTDLKATVKHLNQSFQRMARTEAYKNAVIGHFKGLELLGDHTKDGEVHPHFHCLLIVPSNYFTSKDYLSQAKWREMWAKALKVDYEDNLQVVIKRIKPNVRKRLSAVQSAVFEVAKYAIKHTELIQRNDEDFSIIINQTKGMRFRSTGGYLKEKINLLKLDEDLIGLKEQTEALWEEVEEEVYNWLNGDYRLKKVTKEKFEE